MAWHDWLPEAATSLLEQVQSTEEHQAPCRLQRASQARCCIALGGPQQRCQGMLLPEQSLQQPCPVLHLKLGQAWGRGAPAEGCPSHSQPCSLQLMHCLSAFMHTGGASTGWALRPAAKPVRCHTGDALQCSWVHSPCLGCNMTVSRW